MKVEVTTPEDYMGDVIGDINSRRGRIEGMDDIGGGKMIRGYVPLSGNVRICNRSSFQNSGTVELLHVLREIRASSKECSEKVLAKKD